MIEPRDIDLNLLVVFQEVFQERQISAVARRSLSACNISGRRCACPSLQTNVFWHRRFNQDPGSQWLRSVIGKHFAE